MKTRTIALLIVIFLHVVGIQAQPMSMPQNMPMMPTMDENAMRAQEEQYLNSLKEKAPGLYGYQKKAHGYSERIPGDSAGF